MNRAKYVLPEDRPKRVSFYSPVLVEKIKNVYHSSRTMSEAVDELNRLKVPCADSKPWTYAKMQGVVDRFKLARFRHPNGFRGQGSNRNSKITPVYTPKGPDTRERRGLVELELARKGLANG